jgi:hypothetical protein
MAANFKITAAVANAMADALGAMANSGKLRIYDGTQPANPGTAPTGSEHLLAELTMAADAFPAASGGVLTAAAITQDSSVDASGTATWFRLLASDGTTALCDGSAGASGCDLNLTPATLVAGGTCSVSSFTITMPQA